jgi:hypothetical protein
LAASSSVAANHGRQFVNNSKSSGAVRRNFRAVFAWLLLAALLNEYQFQFVGGRMEDFDKVFPDLLQQTTHSGDKKLDGNKIKKIDQLTRQINH